MGCSVHGELAATPRKRIVVNGVAIPHDDISREAQNYNAQTPLAAWTAAARALVVRTLLLGEAQRLELANAPAYDDRGRRETDEEAAIRTLIEREVTTPVPDDDACRRYYDHNRRRFRSADIYEAAHILFAARKEDAPRFAQARADAVAALEILAREPGRFAELAKAHSACPSAAHGGNLGQISTGETTPEFEAALTALAPGETTAHPVESRYGVHIIRLERRIDGRDLPFEMVRDRIATYLTERVNRMAVAQYVARLAGRAEIEGVTLPMPADLRVA